MTGFEGRLHGPALPDDGLPTRARFAAGALLVDAGGRAIDAARVGVEAAGFNQEDVALSWDEAAGRFALVVDAPAAKQALLAAAPAALARPLRRWRRDVNFTRTFWRAAATLALTAAVVLALGIWQYDAVVAWTAAQMSPENELRLGRSIMDGVRREGHLVETAVALDTIRSIGGRLTRNSTRKYEWHLKDDPSVNAFAIPGGFVVVHAGLVHAADSADELAAVLAHEIQHVEQRHTLQALLYQLGWATALTLVLGDPSTLTTLLLLQVGNLKFSRDLEAAADAGAVAALQDAGVPPEAMAQFFRKLAAGGGTAPAWLSTHPATSDRIAAVEAAAKGKPCAECRASGTDWSAVRESLYAEGLIRRPAAAAP